jgi:hypothetical protein
MKLQHAIKVGERMLKQRELPSEEKIALTVLTRFSKRVHEARLALSTLAKAVGEDLNQDDLFKE